LLGQWNDNKTHTAHLEMNSDNDEVIWSLAANKRFSTKFVYQLFESNIFGPNFK
jgi:hypothetical protein